MFFKIWLTNLLTVMFVAFLVTSEHYYPQTLDGALFAAVVLAGAAYVWSYADDRRHIVPAHTVRSVCLVALCIYFWQIGEYGVFATIAAIVCGIWSVQQAYEAAVLAEKAVGHNKLSIPYGFAAWGVIGLVLGPLVLLLVGLNHGHDKLRAETLRVAK